MTRVDKTKYLEVINYEKLNWNAQFHSTRSRISTCLRSLKRPKNILPDVQLCCVLYGLVESHLRYGDNVWYLEQKEASSSPNSSNSSLLYN